MEEFVSAAAVISLSVKFTDFLKYLTNRNTNAAVTQAVVWLGGILAVLLAGAADIANGVDLGGAPLGDLDLWSQVFIGLGLSSTGSFLYDFKKARDNTDSAYTPNLLGHSDSEVYVEETIR